MDTDLSADRFHHRIAAFAATVDGADPESRVPTCPDWPLRVLVGHLGQAHRWAAATVRSGPAPVPDPWDATPGDPAGWAAWLADGAAELAEAVGAAGDRPVWTFFGPGPASFWLRRMLYDATIHHADAVLATGAELTPAGGFAVSPELAADVISDWLAIVSDPAATTLRPAFAALRGTGQTLRLRPGTGPGWTITRVPEGVRWSRGDDGDADTTLAGDVLDLLLVLTRRLPPGRVTITGDTALAEHWIANTAA